MRMTAFVDIASPRLRTFLDLIAIVAPALAAADRAPGVRVRERGDDRHLAGAGHLQRLAAPLAVGLA